MDYLITHFQWSSLSILSSRFPLWRLLCWIDWHQKLQLCRAAPYIGDKNAKTHRTVIEIPSQNKAVHTSDLKKPSTPLIEIASQSAFVALQGQRRRWECRLSGERQEGKKGLWFPGRLAQLRKLLFLTNAGSATDGRVGVVRDGIDGALFWIESLPFKSTPIWTKKVQPHWEASKKLQYLKIFSNHSHRQSGILWASLILSLFGD